MADQPHLHPRRRDRLHRPHHPAGPQPDPANQFAIVIDGAVVSSPAVREPISGGDAVISGSFTRTQAETLAAQLATTDLPAGLHPTT
ncbi:SecDF P1 head subdomain-containing protein [Kitasatospora cheerisanensis]|uniref:SecDF P1 head subdomain-containing protein n=1 Tax=Kitasatospora cheerisanensis TaxID=81942 RepID=UPI000AA3D6DE|nr:hypothetical protein [Kitasatospora cheerisanensis]